MILYQRHRIQALAFPSLQPPASPVCTGKIILDCLIKRLSTYLHVIKCRARKVQQRGIDSLADQVQGCGQCLVQTRECVRASKLEHLENETK